MIFIWIVLPIIAIGAVIFYLFRKIYRAVDFCKGEMKKSKKNIAAIVGTVLILTPAVALKGTWFFVLLHLAAFLLIIDLIMWIGKKVRKDDDMPKAVSFLYRTGIVAIALTVATLTYGYFNIFNVISTNYTVTTEKNIRSEGYKLALISDLHYGITLNKEQLEIVVERINKENPDIVILDGDLVDESTTLPQMKEAFKTLSGIHNKYGIYYVYGNHDKNNYTLKPYYTPKALAEEITKDGITILEDNVEKINNDLVLVGRADRGDGNFIRKNITALTKGLDKNKQWIVLDHQPCEYSEVKKAGGDIILSGHTHAGQILPIGLISPMLHMNDLNYGYVKEGNLNEIVTSGIAGWGYPIRTEKHSEYVIINIKNK